MEHSLITSALHAMIKKGAYLCNKQRLDAGHQSGLDCICLTTTHVLRDKLAVLHQSGDITTRLLLN